MLTPSTFYPFLFMIAWKLDDLVVLIVLVFPEVVVSTFPLTMNLASYYKRYKKYK